MQIREVRFRTADIESTEAFYRTVLRLPTRRTESQLVVKTGWTDIILTEGAVTPGAQHLAFTIPRNQFNEAKAWLVQRVGVLSADGADEFECQPIWNARSLYFEGPDQNVFEFIIRRDLPTDAREPFEGESILGVSEVGVPVEDVTAVQQSAHDVLALEPYGQGGPTFRPIGDTEGLLILAEKGRAWFPTQHHAVMQPLEIVLDGAAAGHLTANPLCKVRTS